MTTQELETFDVININNVVSTLLLGDPENFRSDVLKYAAGKLCFEDLYTRAIDCNVWPGELDQIIDETEAECIRETFIDDFFYGDE